MAGPLSAPFLSRTVVTRIWPLSARVKAFALRPEAPVVFSAGQSLDVHLPGSGRVVGEYALFTSPREYARQGQLHIAVQASRHPAARWMHDKCEVGTKLAVGINGNNVFDPNKTPANVLLVAGGSGISPAFGMLKEIAATPKVAKCMLLHSARQPDDFLFQQEIDALVAQQKQRLGAMRFWTREGEAADSSDALMSPTATEPLRRRRIGKEDLQEALRHLAPGPLHAFIVGPMAMVEGLADTLRNLGVPSSALKTE